MVNARSIQGILVLIISLFLAIWLGLSIVTDQTETLIQLSAASVILTAIFLGRKVWLLLIFFSAANVVLAQGIGTIEVGQILFLGMTAATFLMRKLRFKVVLGELELWILLIVICVVQAYMRNPVGLNVFGGSTVGGRPYVVLALSIASGTILSSLIVDPKEIKFAYRLSIVGSLLGVFGSILRAGNISGGGEEDLARIPSLANFGQILSLWLSSRISPLRACLHPFWGIVLLLSIAAAAGSAYRNAVAGIALTYLFAIAYRGGAKSLFLSLMGGSMALILLALINLNFPLPGNIQRALSPLPGTWEEQYTKGADDSTEWRVVMWKEALLSDRWIQNKTFGDGIGMTAAQLQSTETIRAVGRTASGLLVQQESMLINGSYHSGPVHSIRAVGYVGLVVLLLAMIRVAVHAHRQILRCKGTEWFPVALYFGIPLMVLPIFFTLVFGEYQTGVASTMLGIAMVRLIERNIPLPPWQKRRYQPYILNKKGNSGSMERASI